ncbi:MAG: hypothetical protein ABIH99_02465 [Candidatus Micrarchaeota archaeon]
MATAASALKLPFFSRKQTTNSSAPQTKKSPFFERLLDNILFQHNPILKKRYSKRLTSTDWEEKRDACIKVGLLQFKWAVPYLLDILDDDKVIIYARTSALWALGEIGAVEQVPLIRKFLSHPAHFETAAEALGKLNAVECAPDIRERLKTLNSLHISPSWGRTEMFRSLADINDREAVPLIEPYLEHAEISVSQAAAEALIRLGSASSVAPRLFSADFGVRQKTAEHLCNALPEDIPLATNFLLKALSMERDGRVITYLIRAINKLSKKMVNEK